MSGKVRRLAVTWGNFWRALEDTSARGMTPDGTLEFEGKALNDVLCRSLAEAYEEGVTGGLVHALDPEERRN